jgi:sensor histidine kinase YesM
MNISVSENLLGTNIPPLTVQMLVENCIKHNIISNDKPLEIQIFTSDDFLIVENRIQAKMDVPKSGHGLKNIIERYSFFTERKPEIHENATHFRVQIPLLINEK